MPQAHHPCTARRLQAMENTGLGTTPRRGRPTLRSQRTRRGIIPGTVSRLYMPNSSVLERNFHRTYYTFSSLLYKKKTNVVTEEHHETHK